MLAREKIPSSMGRSTAVFSIPMATRDRRRAAASRSFFRTRFLWANAFSLLAERIKIENRGAVEVNAPKTQRTASCQYVSLLKVGRNHS